ncbi:2-nitropropane dioxygenase, partial [Thermodesulfobacteriota bacterium]
MKQSSPKAKGWWVEGDSEPETGNHAIKSSVLKITEPVILLDLNGQVGIGRGGTITLGENPPAEKKQYPLLAYAPPLHPENLGDPYFKKTHNLRYAYIAGAMADGITSVEMVEAVGRAGMIGFFGAAGLLPEKIEAAILQLKQRLNHMPFGFNLINSPHEPELEKATVDLYIKHGIKLISASAYLDLTLPLVYFRVKGIHRDPDGRIICPNRVIAKVSRVEVAAKFFSPPPDKMLTRLVPWLHQPDRPLRAF